MHGVWSLLQFIRYYERLLAGALEGEKIRYGQAEPWKQVAKLHGRTKLSRAPNRVKRARYKNDGRPPDTAKALLIRKKRRMAMQTRGKKSLKAKANAFTVFGSETTDPESEPVDIPLMCAIAAPGPLLTMTASPSTTTIPGPLPVITSSLLVIAAPIYLDSESGNPADALEIDNEGYGLSMLSTLNDQYPSYPWASNFCWLDSALEAIFQVIMRDFSSFETRFTEIPTSSVLYQCIGF